MTKLTDQELKEIKQINNDDIIVIRNEAVERFENNKQFRDKTIYRSTLGLVGRTYELCAWVIGQRIDLDDGTKKVVQNALNTLSNENIVRNIFFPFGCGGFEDIEAKCEELKIGRAKQCPIQFDERVWYSNMHPFI